MRSVVLDRRLTPQHLLHDVHVLSGPRDRLREGLAVPAFDDLGSGNTEAQGDASLGEVVQGERVHGRRRRGPGGELHDRRAEPDPLGVGRDPGERREGVRAPGLGREGDVVTERLGLLGHLDEVRMGLRLPVPELESELDVLGHGGPPVRVHRVREGASGCGKIEGLAGGVTMDPSQIDIHDPDRYVEGVPYEEFRWLRANRPVFYQELPEGRGYWAVTRHADVVEVSKDLRTFSSERAGVIISDTIAPERNKLMMLSMDPPHHQSYRRLVTHAFTPKMVAELEPRIRAITRGIMEEAAALGEVDVVTDMAAKLPMEVIGELMDVPNADRPKLTRWAERNVGFDDPELAPTPEEIADAGQSMGAYGYALAKERIGGTGDDLITAIINAEVDGERMDGTHFGVFFNQIATAANETTRTLLAAGLDVLLDHPEAMAELREHPAKLPRAVEEMLRFITPLHYFRRTATRDARIAGQPIAEGERVVMLYASANRDEAVFEHPDVFDIHRHPNPHLAFGIGEHFCVGAKLARLEARVFFEELLGRFRAIERNGAVRRQRSNLSNALKALPVRLRV